MQRTESENCGDGKARAIANRWADRGLTGTQTLSGRIPGLRLRPEFVQHGCTNSMGLLCGLSASDKGNEDRRHFRLCNLVTQGPRDAKGEFKREVEKELTLRETESRPRDSGTASQDAGVLTKRVRF